MSITKDWLVFMSITKHWLVYLVSSVAQQFIMQHEGNELTKYTQLLLVLGSTVKTHFSDIPTLNYWRQLKKKSGHLIDNKSPIQQVLLGAHR